MICIQVKEFHYDPSTPFFSILVPTADTTKFSFFLKRLYDIDKHVMLIGTLL
jgi:hypothetical protein